MPLPAEPAEPADPAPAAAGVPAPGQVIAGCRVERLLARGAHGLLLAVTELAAGEGPAAWRALKLFAPGAGVAAAEAEEAARRFAREAATLQRLRHPGIVRVYAAGRAGRAGRTAAPAAWMPSARATAGPGC
jgi:serine/threonine protein kinase